jgi:hypothetical protein
MMYMSYGPSRPKNDSPTHGSAGSRASWITSLAALTLLAGSAASAGSDVGNKQIFGWVEATLVSSERIKMKAKLDTGAKTSSLHALNIERFKRDGQRMVRFDIEDPEDGRRVTLERPLVRSVRIKESEENASSRRPVVELWICIGDIGRNLEVNLVDRSRFIYPLLIGRSAMEGLILVDSDETFTQSPTCGVPGAPT